MKVASFKKVITCQVGDDLAGYGAGITSEAFHDDLYMRGICMDDGTRKAVMISFDLLGLDQDEDETIRRIFREETGIPEENVVFCPWPYPSKIRSSQSAICSFRISCDFFA